MISEKQDLFENLDKIFRALVKTWKEINRKSKISIDEIKGFKDGALLPILEKLTIIAGNAILLNKLKDLESILGYLARIYELTGTSKRFSASHEEHLSYTLPSKETIKCLYIIGALSIYERKVDVLKLIVDQRIPAPDIWEQIKGKPIRIIGHPFFDYQSNEGDLAQFFNETRDLINKHKVYSEWFYNEPETILDSLIAFDFTRGFLIFKESQMEGIYYPKFNNFMRFYTDRTIKFLRNILGAEEYEKIFGKNIKEEIINFMNSAEKNKSTYFSYSWDLGKWRIKELGFEER